MRSWAWLAALACLSACSSSSANEGTLTLNDPYWDHVNVQLVVTKSADCDNTASYVSTKNIVMHKNTTESFTIPDGDSLCWRHDRNPNDPAPGAWSGWTKANLNPGTSGEADL